LGEWRQGFAPPPRQAVRHNRYVILPKDFEAGWKDHAKKKDRDFDFYGF
jgi:26S proteasome regulatory subunit T3